jgi:metal-sulfur cluster biosynthetic enzyme
MATTAGIGEADVHRALAAVEDPELHRPITELNMVSGVGVGSDQVRISTLY